MLQNNKINRFSATIIKNLLLLRSLAILKNYDEWIDNLFVWEIRFLFLKEFKIRFIINYTEKYINYYQIKIS